MTRLTKEVTNPQFEVLKSIQDGLTITETSRYRKCSRTAIYKILATLSKKGMVEKIGYAYSLTDKGIKGLHSFVGLRYNLRQHNLHFKFQILESPKNWNLKRNQIISLPYFNKKIRLKNNEQELFNFGKCKIRTTSKSIIIKLPTIYDKSTEGAVIQSIHLLEQIVPKVERGLKIKLIKDYKANVSIISQEYARINDSLARIYRKEANRLYVTGDDGKIWLITDFSFSTDETEFIHNKKAIDDENTVIPFLNDLRKNPTTFSEVKDVVTGMVQVQQMHSTNIVKHQKVLDEMLITLKKIQENLDGKNN